DRPISPPRWFRPTARPPGAPRAAGGVVRGFERLKPLLPLTADLPPALACRLCLMSAEALARLKRIPEARAYLARCREWAAALRANPLLELRDLRIRLWLGEVASLGQELSTCTRSLELAGDRANRALLTCEEGRAWDAAGNLDRAEACWREADRLSAGLGADPIRV